MAVIKFTNSKSGLGKIIRYITQTEKTEARLVSGQECIAENALTEMRAVKQMHGKTGGRQYIHIVQAFAPDDPVTHAMAHEIGLRLAAYFPQYQAVIATHKDRKHIHSHIVLNSVQFESGLKFQQSRQDMQAVKDFSDALCLEYGLSVIPKKEARRHIPQDEFHIVLKGDSWKAQLIQTIDAAMKTGRKKEEFIAEMQRRGYSVLWSPARKYITYTTPDGKRCRDNKLHDTKYLKESMEMYFGREIAPEKRPSVKEMLAQLKQEKQNAEKHTPVNRHNSIIQRLER